MSNSSTPVELKINSLNNMPTQICQQLSNTIVRFSIVRVFFEDEFSPTGWQQKLPQIVKIPECLDLIRYTCRDPSKQVGNVFKCIWGVFSFEFSCGNG